MKGSLYDRIGDQGGIAALLRHFYADVRQHQLIGPISNRRIRDWPAHLENDRRVLGENNGRAVCVFRANASEAFRPGAGCETFWRLAAVVGVQLPVLLCATRGPRNDRTRAWCRKSAERYSLAPACCRTAQLCRGFDHRGFCHGRGGRVLSEGGSGATVL